MKSTYLKIITTIMVVFLYHSMAFADDNKWFIGAYGGKDTYDSEAEVLTFNADYEKSYITTLIFGRELNKYNNYLSIEGEGQLAKHWKLQDHYELNAVLILRWLSFPWDNVVDTSFAVGDGISYATETPKIEKEKHDETSKTLNYLMLELDAGLPSQPNFKLFARFHHRSGIFGLINGVNGGANSVGFGIKYYFDDFWGSFAVALNSSPELKSAVNSTPFLTSTTMATWIYAGWPFIVEHGVCGAIMAGLETSGHFPTATPGTTYMQDFLME